jgi:hypothetical protein
MGFCEGVGMTKKEIGWKMQTNMRFGSEPLLYSRQAHWLERRQQETLATTWSVITPIVMLEVSRQAKDEVAGSPWR